MMDKMEEMEEKIQALETKVAHLEQGATRKKRSETITSILCLVVVAINILTASYTHINAQKLINGTEEVISGYEDLSWHLGEVLQLIEGQYGIQDKKVPKQIKRWKTGG